MQILSARDLLNIWEQGLSESAVGRALRLLSAAYPESSVEELARLSIGERDGRLLTLRESLLGPQMVSVADCPNCGERLELTFQTSEIRADPPATNKEPLSLQVTDYQVQFRLPNSLDLEDIANYPDAAAAESELVQRCLVSVSYQGKAQSVNRLPADVVSLTIEQMAQADPQGDIELALSCPACEHQWLATFDIVSFFWSELTAWAQRVLQEVHLLASAYSWGEAEILAMSPRRRQLYVEMVRA